jgi:hypothetical protein
MPFVASKQFYFAVSGLKIMSHRNADNNLESLCITKYGGVNAF